MKQADEDFSFLSVQFTVGKIVDGTKDPKGAENEHRKQELMLKRFRIRACNLLIGTNFLEEGIDLPKCNLVIRFDTPSSYRSYINTKERARATDSLYCLLVDANTQDNFVNQLGKYYETEAVGAHFQNNILEFLNVDKNNFNNFRCCWKNVDI